MKIFLDSADIEEIKEAKSWGILDGITTNPSLIKKAVDKYSDQSLDIESYLKKILKICKEIPVSLEVTGTKYNEMVSEGKNLNKKFKAYSKNLYIKIPINPCKTKKCSLEMDGIKAIKTLSECGIKVNCTLIFTPEQALLAAKAGADFVSPFAGRVDDYLRKKAGLKQDKKAYYPAEGIIKNGKIVEDNGIVSGIDLVKKCVEIFKKQKIRSKVLAASIRNTRQVREAALVGADISTVPLEILKGLLEHEKTAEGIRKFLKDSIPSYEKVQIK